jgi:hypothetical protein
VPTMSVAERLAMKAPWVMAVMALPFGTRTFTTSRCFRHLSTGPDRTAQNRCISDRPHRGCRRLHIRGRDTAPRSADCELVEPQSAVSSSERNQTVLAPLVGAARAIIRRDVTRVALREPRRRAPPAGARLHRQSTHQSCKSDALFRCRGEPTALPPRNGSLAERR